MRTAYVVAAMLLASSLVADAQVQRESVPSRDEVTTGRLHLDGMPPPRRIIGPRRVNGWAELADATPTKFGTVWVIVGNLRFATLRVDATKGKVAIRSMRVYFNDGTNKTYAARVTLDQKRKPSTFIDLGGMKAIHHIEITTTASVRGEYTIFANETAAKPTCC